MRANERANEQMDGRTDEHTHNERTNERNKEHRDMKSWYSVWYYGIFEISRLLYLKTFEKIQDFKEKRTLSSSVVSQCLQQTAVMQYRALDFLAIVAVCYFW